MFWLATAVEQAMKRQEAGFVVKRRARGRRRRRREPRACFGELLHLDGSPHAWLAQRPDERQTLIAVLDDATKRLLYAQLWLGETLQAVMTALAHVVQTFGLPRALYTDRAGWAFHTPKAGGPIDRDRLTHVGRALARLGIDHIGAYSPQGRGRGRLAGPARRPAGRLPRRLAGSALPRAVRARGPRAAAARRAGGRRPLPSRRCQPLAARPAVRRPPPSTSPPYRPPAPGRAWSLKADRSRVKHNRTFHLSTTPSQPRVADQELSRSSRPRRVSTRRGVRRPSSFPPPPNHWPSRPQRRAMSSCAPATPSAVSIRRP